MKEDFRQCENQQKGLIFIKNVIESKSFDFAVRIVNLYKHLTANKKEFVLS